MKCNASVARLLKCNAIVARLLKCNIIAAVQSAPEAGLKSLIALLCVGRFQLGEGITKKESDLAADVEEQQQALQAKAAQKKEAAPEAAAEPQQSQQPAVKVPC